MAKPIKNEIVEQDGTLSGADAADFIAAESAQNERGAKQRAAEEAIQSLAKNMSGSDVTAKLAKVMNAKAEAFEENSKDFVKLVPGVEVKGIYLGSVQGPKYKIHAIGTIDAKTKEPMVVRLNGTTILTKELLRGKPGAGVHIKCTGVTKTDGGNKLTETSVAWMA